MTDPTTHIQQKIEKIAAERDAYTEAAQRQVAAYNGAIQVLRQLLAEINGASSPEAEAHDEP